MPALLVPTGVVAQGVSGSAVRVSWNASADPAVVGYDVYEKVWVGGHVGGKGSGGNGHYVENLVGANLSATTDTLSGYAVGSTHTYLVTALSATDASPYSLPATAETFAAPRFPNGPNALLLGVGAVWSGPVPATVGLTTEISPLISGNPLTFSILSGPSTASIDPRTGAVLYTPSAGDVGPVPITLQATDPLGTVTQTVTFTVSPTNPALATPTLVATSTSATYTGSGQQVGVVAYGSDGVTRVNGSFAIADNGINAPSAIGAGTYPQLVTFTSGDPNYGDATLLTDLTITPASPSFQSLSAPSIAAGAATATVSGGLGAGASVPVGDYVTMTLNGVSQQSTVDSNGNFSATFATSGLPAANYPITFSYPGDPNFHAAPNAVATLAVVAPQIPRVTRNPNLVEVTTAGDGASFTATASGSPVISVRWQVSTDNGRTYSNLTSNSSALTDTLVLSTTSTSKTGYRYRAVFTNSAGAATSRASILVVQADSGGGNVVLALDAPPPQELPLTKKLLH